MNNSAPVLGTDVDLLNQLLHLEHVAIAAYTAGTPLLPPATVKAGQLFLNDELAHAGALAGADQGGGRQADQAGAELRRSGTRAPSQEVLDAAAPRSRTRSWPPTWRRSRGSSRGSSSSSVASILANDAQHVAVVRAALGQPAVPVGVRDGRD